MNGSIVVIGNLTYIAKSKLVSAPERYFEQIKETFWKLDRFHFGARERNEGYLKFEKQDKTILITLDSHKCGGSYKGEGKAIVKYFAERLQAQGIEDVKIIHQYVSAGNPEQILGAKPKGFGRRIENKPKLVIALPDSYDALVRLTALWKIF